MKEKIKKVLKGIVDTIFDKVNSFVQIKVVFQININSFNGVGTDCQK